MTSFFGELRRRNVVKVAVAYAIVGWLLVQIADTFFPALQLPEWTVTFVAGLVILGFPLALILSWAYELTPEGMKRSHKVSATESITPVTGRKLDFAIIGALVLAVVFLVVDNYLLEDSAGTLPNSVAVLPFANLSPNPDDAFFAAGIHEEVLNQLVKLSGLNVIARTSMLRYKDTDKTIPEIAAELNVGTVMEGSVRYADDRVLVTAQLINPDTNVHLWSDSYNREFADIFAIQADIAMNIANAMEAEFSLAEQEAIERPLTKSPQAYALYLRAAAALQGEDSKDKVRAMDDLERAITLDPEFARAYLLKARWYDGEFSEDWENVARSAAERALSLDTSLGFAHVLLAFIHTAYGRWTEALEAYEHAYELSPTDPDVLEAFARFNRAIGRYDEAVELNQRAAELDPGNWFYHHLLGVSYRYAKNFDSSILSHEKAIELNPAALNSYVGLAQTEAARGNYDEAVEGLQIAEQLDAGSVNYRLAQMALVYAQADRHEEAVRLLNELENRVDASHFSLALAYLAVGDYDQALQRLEDALDEPRMGDLIPMYEIKANYYADPVLEEPRFQELRDRFAAL